MQPVIPLYKPLGMTPLQAIYAFQKEYPAYQNQKIGYAGRLDPMAEGLLLLLVGEENKKRKQYENLEKEYVFTLLLGISTDTYDTLGILQDQTFSLSKNLKASLQNLLPTYIGTNEQAFPPFSSVHVNGKPLFYWARKGKLGTIVIPKKTIAITSLDLLSSSHITAQQLQQKIMSTIKRVQGDFRQQQILNTWETFFKTAKQTFPVFKLRVTCSTGTYIRSLCHDIGKKLGMYGITLSIFRTRVGTYDLKTAKTLPATKTRSKS